MATKKLLFAAACAAPLCAGSASGDVLLTSGFDNNTGATVLAGNTDNTSGSSSVTITDWATDASVTAISGLTAISSNDGGATQTGAGFVQLQNGTATYANDDVVFLNPNHNDDATRENNRRGFSFVFTIDADQVFENLTVMSGHTNNQGTQAQVFTSDLNFTIVGGAVNIGGETNVDYGATGTTTYAEIELADGTGTALAAGTYTVSVWQDTMPGGGAYATYDGVTLNVVPEPGSMALLALGGLMVARRRRG